MPRVSALQLRQGLNKLLAALENGGEPVLVERNRKAVAALISMRDHAHLPSPDAPPDRAALEADLDGLIRPSVDARSSIEILREARGHA